MDEFDELRKRELREQMVERVERGFRGWTRPDGTFVDGDGRGDYRRLYGSSWKHHYEDDRAYAMSMLAQREIPTAGAGERPGEHARPASAFGAVRQARGTIDRMRQADATSDSRLAAFLVGSGGELAGAHDEDPIGQARRWAEEALASEADSPSPGPAVAEVVAVTEASPTTSAPDVAPTGQPPRIGRRSIMCPACGASNAPHRADCLVCGTPFTP